MRSVELIKEVEVHGSRIVVHPEPSALGRFFREPFWVEYEEGVDVASWPYAWQTAPFVLNVAPVVWAGGVLLTVPVLDRRLAGALGSVRELFRKKLYPSVGWQGSIVAGQLVDSTAPSSSADVGVLFSGGLDSVATSMRHFAEHQQLIVVRGADLAEQDSRGWEYVVAGARNFASVYGHEVNLVSSNLRSFIDNDQLHGLDPNISDWWGQVQHGMGLLGLAAPLASSLGMKRIYIASSHTPSFEVPWGSSPAIDEAIGLGGLSVLHDGYESTRQQKLKEVIEIANARALPLPQLRVCYSNPAGGGSNCGKCEKCLRTAAGALLEAGDLLQLGFADPPERYTRLIARKFARYSVPSSPNSVWMWQDIQQRGRWLLEHDPQRLSSAARELAEWLTAFNFAAYDRRYVPVKRARKLVQKALRRYPALFRFARRVAIRLEDR